MLISVFAACAERREAPHSSRRLRGEATRSLSTSRDSLVRAIDELRAHVAKNPRDADAAATLAEALLRQTRVATNAGLAAEAERVLVTVLNAEPGHYGARRILGAVYLSEHRFREALTAADRCLTVRKDDTVVDGIAGDAHLELGEYDEAFAAFDRMNATKPTAASYARSSYARELLGDLPQALHFMQMATEATPPQDAESLAWHHAQLGHLYLEIGRLNDAHREYSQAEYLFPGHPFASDGLARVAAAKGDYPRALAIVNDRLKGSPLPADFALAGDLLAVLGRADEAERHYRLAEAAWRSDMPEPSRLARFLAERGRRLDEATRLAETTVKDRRDIFTADALAWSYFQTGRTAEAHVAIAQALRTGTRDRIILYHAAEIERRVGNRDRARRLVASSLEGSLRFDPVTAPKARALRDALGPPQIASR